MEECKELYSAHAGGMNEITILWNCGHFMVKCDFSTAVRICVLTFRRWISVAAVTCDSSSFSGLV
jgi:hypothetical protein